MVAVDADGNPIPPSTYNPGVASPTGGGTSNGLDFHPDDVRTLAKKTLKTAENLDNKTFTNLALPTGLYWDFEGGEDVVEAHQVAHGITTKTLTGLQTDLTDFSTYLTQAVDDTENVDDQVRALLMKLAEAPEGSAADDAYRDAHDDTDVPEAWDEPPTEGEDSPTET